MTQTVAEHQRAYRKRRAEKMARLERENAAYRKALVPFVIASESLDDTHPDNADLWESGAAMALNAGDLRRARTALGQGSDGRDAQ